jgi:Glycosyl transferase family 8
LREARPRLPDDAHKLFDWINGVRRLALAILSLLWRSLLRDERVGSGLEGCVSVDRIVRFGQVMWERFTKRDKASLRNIRADLSAPNVVDEQGQPTGGFLFGRSPHYFNFGVIAVNFANWNPHYVHRYREAVKSHALNCDYKTDCGTNDQCAWNMTFERSWRRLPLTMNFQATAIFSERWSSSTVRHYVGRSKYIPFKPWRNDVKDTTLINEARDILGVGPVGLPCSKIIRALNVIRNRKKTEAVGQAIGRIEAMFCEEM